MGTFPYGLIALFFGAGLEGEFAVVAGGILARHGSFPLAAAIIVSTLGSFTADQIWYFVGRYARNSQLVARVRTKRLFARALDLLERRPVPFILGFRFVYGMRSVSPVAIGVAGIPVRLFLPLNMIAALIWAPSFSWLGYRAGKAVLPMLHRIGEYGIIVLIVLLVSAPMVWGLVRWRRARSAGQPRLSEMDDPA